jgi:hypothetical protein
MRRSNFTIAEIMLVIAVAAIFLSAGEIVFQYDSKKFSAIRDLLILRAISGVMIGAIIGVCMGVSRRHRYWGGTVGFFEGGTIGGCAATILSVPECSHLAAIGAAVLLAFGVVVRVFSRRAPKNEIVSKGEK